MRVCLIYDCLYPYTVGDPELDAIVLTTPVPSHAELAQRVLAAGKHCFVEKPLAQSAADAQLAVDAAKQAGRLLMVGHLLEYHPGIRLLKEVLDSGELGKARYTLRDLGWKAHTSFEELIRLMTRADLELLAPR